MQRIGVTGGGCWGQGEMEGDDPLWQPRNSSWKKKKKVAVQCDCVLELCPDPYSLKLIYPRAVFSVAFILQEGF